MHLRCHVLSTHVSASSFMFVPCRVLSLVREAPSKSRCISMMQGLPVDRTLLARADRSFSTSGFTIRPRLHQAAAVSSGSVPASEVRLRFLPAAGQMPDTQPMPDGHTPSNLALSPVWSTTPACSPCLRPGSTPVADAATPAFLSGIPVPVGPDCQSASASRLQSDSDLAASDARDFAAVAARTQLHPRQVQAVITEYICLLHAEADTCQEEQHGNPYSRASKLRRSLPHHRADPQTSLTDDAD